MTDFNQQLQQVESQINIGKIDQAQFNLPPELWERLMAVSAGDQKEDLTLAELKTERWEPETLLIPAGEFVMGSGQGEGIPWYETPQFSYQLPAYRIGKFPVRNSEYHQFARETNRQIVPEMGWENGHEPSPRQQDLPVRGITWYDARAYCLWLFEKTKRPYTLPSEAQWEKAARGASGAVFPWGDEWNEGKNCNVNPQKVTAVFAYPAAKSPFGCFDMVGNIREWTTTLWGRRRRPGPEELSKYPWQAPWKANVGPDELDVNRQVRRATRGGTAILPGTQLRAARRTSELPYRRGLASSRTGFRVAINLEE